MPLIYDPNGMLSDHAKGFEIAKTPAEVVSRKSDVVFIVEDEKLEQILASCEGSKIALFTTKHKSASEFMTLKKRGVNFLLETPVQKEEFEALQAALEGRIEISSADMSSELPPELIQKYADSLYDKIAEIEDFIQKVESSPPNKEDLVNLRNGVHKLAGNAASYGFPVVTSVCRAHEKFLEENYADEHVSQETKERIVKENALFFRKFLLAFQKIPIVSVR
ncbi:MAG: Hpt domain-containing protein [Chlamydiales bacterium]|nr:Hpt domain-containing protein [Chlamydiales bacterium]